MHTPFRPLIIIGSLALLGSACAVAPLALMPSPAASESDKAPSRLADHSPDQPVANPTRRTDDTIEFNRDIRPILSENCFACHGPDLHHAEANLSLHTFEMATKPLEGDIFAIVPGDPMASEAWHRIIDDDDPMPPEDSHKKLTDEQKELIKRWIEQGAEYQPHWAYVKPKAWPTPEVSNKGWSKHWIDHFILNRLESHNLNPVADANRIALIRRAHFDLTGLPPTPETVDAFVKDRSPQAFEKVLDQLLASQHFGERMAMYWLDLVRFADSVGYHGDQTQNISPYRDWVIWAFNENMPYNTFITHQIAGDLLPDVDDNSKIASAYNRLQQTSHEGGVQAKEYMAIYDADRVRNFSEAFMGSTIGCAQCHDHKYDPYTAQDFYSLAAFFGQIDDMGHLTNKRENGKGRKKINRNKLPTPREPEIDVLSPLDHQRIAALKQDLTTATNEPERQAIQASIDAIQPRRVMISKQAADVRPVRFLPRGNWMDDSGDVMPAAVPTFMGTLTSSNPTRLDLAKWLVTPMDAGGSGELTARVLVNRLWYLAFGEGLCTTLGDFGGQGEPPNHPELLDRLAIEFVESGWDIKAFMKTMMLTRTYQLSSAADPQLIATDPNNVLFARQSQHRLIAEMIRDHALVVSGLLVDQLGGESARPYQPKGYYKHLNFPKRTYKTHTDTNQWRRGVYVHWQRQFLHPMLKAFDAPSREECTAKRPISNTPLAALALLNDPTFVEAARHFAQRILTEAPQQSDRTRLDWAMRQSLSRPASADEAAIMLNLLKENRQTFKAKPESAEILLEVGQSEHDISLDTIELAAWAELCRLILNLHETITRP